MLDWFKRSMRPERPLYPHRHAFMSDTKEWAFSSQLRPRQETLDFDLDRALNALVLLHAEVSEDAVTANVLGTERLGSGVAIAHEGRELVLTIGYLIAEAESIWLTTHDGRVNPGHALAYDPVTGFGLVLPFSPLNVSPLALGSIRQLTVGDALIVASHGGLQHALNARLIAIREFAGYWEYLLEHALFTSPAHPHWSGAALIGRQGELLGIGSLLTQETTEGETFDANMFVPVDLLQPLMTEMIEHGGTRGAARPWLGVQAGEQEHHVVIAGITPGGPADRAGIRAGDVILEVGGRKVSGLAQFFRILWACGPAGIEIEMAILRPGRSSAKAMLLKVPTVSRQAFLKKPQRH